MWNRVNDATQGKVEGDAEHIQCMAVHACETVNSRAHTHLALIFEREKTFMSSSGVGWVTVERMVPNAPLTDVIQFLFACSVCACVCVCVREVWVGEGGRDERGREGMVKERERVKEGGREG